MLNLTKIKHFLLRHWFLNLWRGLRQLSGDDAYEQYLKHHAQFHASNIDAPQVLSRKEFFKIWQDNKWKGIKRCC